MSRFTIYNSDSTEIQFETDSPITNVFKFCSYKNRIFILSTNNELFHGTIEKKFIKLYLNKQGIIDIECYNDAFYKIDENGCVHKIDLNEFDNDLWTEIVIPNSTKTCPHGFKCITEKIKISKINCNNDGILFTSHNCELYGMGNFAEVLKSDYPVKVQCFSGFKILQVSMGDNFAVVLTSKKIDHPENDYDNSSLNEELPDVYLSTDCQKCPSRSNLHCIKNISKSTTETSMASSPSSIFDSEENLKDIRSHIPSSTNSVLNGTNFSIINKANKESTINFLLESLSISSEDFIEAGKQTKLIKENVSNITSMVYEGVKTLSRHMSGSDNNDTPPLESFEIIDNSAVTTVVPNKATNDGGISLSETSSIGDDYYYDDDIDDLDMQNEFGLEKKINNLCRYGNSLITSGVWSFGSINKEGQLGTGDQVKRNIIIQVLKLQSQGVSQISTGKDHSIAVTLDGRLFLWGSNVSKQISNENYNDYSAPKLFKSKERVLDAICTEKSTVILLNDLNVYEKNKITSKSSSFEITKKYIPNDSIKIPNFLASGNLFIVNYTLFSPICDFLTIEQKFLFEIIQSYNSVIKPFLKKTACIPNGQLYDSLCHLYLNIVNITTINVKSLQEYYTKHINCSQIIFIKNLNEIISLYRNYLKKFCNILCINGFEHISYLTCNEKPSNIRKIFDNPFRRIWGYMEMIDEFLKYENDFFSFLDEKRNLLDKFRIEKDTEIDKADKTIKFWKSMDKSMICELQEPERRLILDSKEIPIKLSPAQPFSTQRFILLSDYLCHGTNPLSKFHLTTLWVESVQDTESRKHILKILTPETHFIVAARNHEDKMKWLEEISKCIKMSLHKPISAKVPFSRNTSYEFSNKHLTYPGGKYFGMWSNSHMHGIGRLEFADGRVYNGLMTNGEIQGFGQMFTPNHGTYEGNFENGKYHGYGILEMKNKKRYKGNFKNGEFSGHGKLENDNAEYVGEFLKNMKNGYGILDDKLSGDKYLGMFENNKKQGVGVLFTQEGNYFNGVFVDDHISGDGIALLQDGSYYRGELNIFGPNGKGSLYITTPKKESLNLDDYKTICINGRQITGVFGGTWNNIKIQNGQLGMDAIESEEIDLRIINPDKKWTSLFKDWETEVFGENYGLYKNYTIWNKISVYISNSKRKEKLKSDGFAMKNHRNYKHFDSSNEKLTKKYNSETLSILSSLSNKSSQYSKRSTLDIKDTYLADVTDNSNINQKSVSNEMLSDDNRNITEYSDVIAVYNSDESLHNLSSSYKEKQNKERILESTPNFGIKILTKDDVIRIKEYLFQAFQDKNHPLGVLISKISKCFYFSYGHWNNKKPSILTRQALDELESISIRIYHVIRKLFPALPETYMLIDEEKLSHRSFYSILLSNSIYSSLFVLYASKCSPLDEICQRRIRFTDKKTDEELLTFLKIDTVLLPLVKHNYYREAILSFRQVETKFCPMEMLSEIKKAYEYIAKACFEIFEDSFVINTDYLIPLTIFLILRANIPHVGAELLLLEDLLESEYELNGEAGACFTHIKASYSYIISSNFYED